MKLNQVNLHKSLHNRRYNHQELVKLNQYWRHFCQKREAQGQSIINQPKQVNIKKVQKQLISYAQDIKYYSRDSKQFIHADNNSDNLIFGHINPQGYNMINKNRNHYSLTTRELAIVITISQDTFHNYHSAKLSNQIAKKIAHKL